MPAHIGIILDGNRRHGDRRGIEDPHAIYSLGARKIDEVLSWCAAVGIPAVALRVLSTEYPDGPVDRVSGFIAASAYGRLANSIAREATPTISIVCRNKMRRDIGAGRSVVSSSMI